MRQIQVEELKQIQLGILDHVAEFCEKNGIQYWLDCGTLLGAIRHKGYIPWDDDIDIGMLRPDFDRFIRTYNESNSRYQVYCIDTTPGCFYAYAKVMDCSTVLYEPDEKGIKVSINIDIFVYDNAPDDDGLLDKMYNKRDFLRDCNTLRNLNNFPSGNIFRRCFIRFLRLLVKPFPQDYFVVRLAKNSKKYALQRTKRVGNFLSFSRIVCDKEIVSNYIDCEFEGKMYKAPIGYDQWLYSFYGDYMQLPPVEKRVTHHKFVAYIID